MNRRSFVKNTLAALAVFLPMRPLGALQKAVPTAQPLDPGTQGFEPHVWDLGMDEFITGCNILYPPPYAGHSICFEDFTSLHSGHPGPSLRDRLTWNAYTALRDTHGGLPVSQEAAQWLAAFPTVAQRFLQGSLGSIGRSVAELEAMGLRFAKPRIRRDYNPYLQRTKTIYHFDGDRCVTYIHEAEGPCDP